VPQGYFFFALSDDNPGKLVAIAQGNNRSSGWHRQAKKEKREQ